MSPRAVVFTILATGAFAQAPSVTAVIDQVTGKGGLSPGGRAIVYYSPSSPKATAVTVGGLPAKVVAWDGASYVLLPRELPPGPAALAITTSGGVSAAYPITLASYSPGLVAPPSTYCQRDQPQGISLSATGLGPSDPVLPTIDEGPIRPLPTALIPHVTVGGLEAEVISSVLVPQTYGVYVVTVKPAPGTPDGLQPVVLSIAGQSSNSVNLFIGMTTQLATFGATPGHGAPEAILTAKSCSGAFAAETVASDGRNPPTSLAATNVTVKDSLGVERPAPLYYVSPTQVNYTVPGDTALGPATVTVASAGRAVAHAPLNVQPVEPGIFGSYLVRIHNGNRSAEPIGDDGLIDLGPEGDQVYLVLSATGLRGRSSPGNVRLIAGSVEAAAEYAGPQGEFAGLDQVNVRLPRSLAGLGLDHENGQAVILQVDGAATIAGTFRFR